MATIPLGVPEILAERLAQHREPLPNFWPERERGPRTNRLLRQG